MGETSTLLDVVDPQQPDLNWRRVSEQPTGDITRGLYQCGLAEAHDGQAAFIWRLRVIVHTRALYSHVQLPRSHVDHISSTDWTAAVKEFANVGRTHAHKIIQRRLADPWPMRTILDKVSEMERVSAERHRPVEYPKIGTMIGWFPDPRGVERQRKPARVTAMEAHIEELEGTIETLHAEKSEDRREKHMLLLVIVAQQAEIERLNGYKVVDDRRPKSREIDMKVVEEAWAAELRRRGS